MPWNLKLAINFSFIYSNALLMLASAITAEGFEGECSREEKARCDPDCENVSCAEPWKGKTGRK